MTGTIQEFDLTVNVTQALLWQYNEALRLQSLMEEKQDWYNKNQTQFWDDWYRDVFDLRTANEFGCTVWSIILDFPLAIEIANGGGGVDNWGFEGFRKNFENGNFSSGENSFVKPTLSIQRTLLRLRYYQLVSKGTVPEANKFAKEIFGDGVHVLDGLDMTAEYVFTRAMTADEKFILKYYDILPRPAGVGVTFSVLTDDAFGFEQFRANFNNGNFRG